VKHCIRLFLIISLILLVVSCATRINKSVVEEDTASLLMRKLAVYNDSIQEMTGKAIMFYKDGNRTLSFRATVVSRNGDLRLDLNDFVFKKPVLTLIKRGSDVLIIQHMKKEFYLMKYDVLDLEKLAGIDILPDILLPSITGRVYIIDEHSSVSPLDFTTLRIEGSNMHEEIQFNEDSLPTRTTITSLPVVYILTLKKFNRYNNVFFPQKISLTDGEKVLEISYSEVHINEYIDNSSFNIEKSIPRGYVEEHSADTSSVSSEYEACE